MDHCCAHEPSPGNSPAYRRVLWMALILNALMFFVEVGAGLAAGSVSLQADALDFFGDAANYSLSLFVLSMALVWRARAAMLKGASMGLFGIWVLGAAALSAASGTVPGAEIMGVVGVLALAVNVGVALMLYRFRDGDANMRSVWLCTRNDAIGNLAVLAAAIGVFGTGSGWPDIVVASIMAVLALSSCVEVLRRARAEMNGVELAHVHHGN